MALFGLLSSQIRGKFKFYRNSATKEPCHRLEHFLGHAVRWIDLGFKVSSIAELGPIYFV